MGSSSSTTTPFYSNLVSVCEVIRAGGIGLGTFEADYAVEASLELAPVAATPSELAADSCSPAVCYY